MRTLPMELVVATLLRKRVAPIFPRRVAGKTDEAAMGLKQPNISKRATDLLKRIYDGRWYAAHGRTPKAMAELVAAGLVVQGGRVRQIAACYVPPGTIPFQCETMPEPPKWLV